ncbi:MAG: hypothetical protein EAZ53_01385 [Bacteroidetes bacterium]|nr:MAG: hypothetical protein EAZ53_01385 [Bacteroidota bacterium]
MNNVSFPDDLEKKEDVRNATNLIRLITRVVFIWFIKEKSLVPNQLFDRNHLKKILKSFNPDSEKGVYYHAILQNLFFGTLNQKMDERKFAKDGGNIKTNGEEYGVKNLFRYADLFNITEIEAMQLFKDVPFLNGGLFDCLDKPNEEGIIVYVDGFSRNPKKQASVPDYIFFGEEREIDLNDIYATKNKTYKSKGLINLLESYKFTVAENTPLEEEVALDPELLGKVFENLLASYNPETQTTARKQTGSFYTPREIVNYMVDESLIEYLKQTIYSEAPEILELGNKQTDMFGNKARKGQLKLESSIKPNRWKGKEKLFEENLKQLFSYEPIQPFTDPLDIKELIEAINNCKILDPACGSGAYPMGILHKMVYLLQKLDPDNKYWREIQEHKAIDETKDAFKIGNQQEREIRLKEISDVFENNASDYGRKLYLIENCIYGIDIQPIAVQISKLRFFISLVIDQKEDKTKENFGVRSLPNLETKFVAANTLIGLDKPAQTLLRNPDIEVKENQLKELRHKYFTANTRKEKLQYQKQDKKLRQEIAKMLESDGWQTAVAKQIVAFDPFDQNTFAPWFNPEWMFGLTTGFDIVIGNPPYGITFSEKEIIYFREKYKVVAGHSEAYYLFIESGILSLKENGVLSYITPNAWLSNKYASGVRNWLLNNTKLNVLINLNKKFVFENAGVEAAIFILTNSKNNKIFSTIVGNDIKEEGLYKFDYSVWHTNEFFNISFSSNPKENLIVQGVQDTPFKMSDLLDISNGFKPYQVGYGLNLKNEILTEEDVQNKIYHSKTKIGKDYKPQLKGKNISKYYYDFTEGYIKWGNWLMSPKDERYFENKKILIRQITGETLIAAIDDDDFYADQTMYIAIGYLPSLVSLEYCLAIFNSKILGFYFRKFYSEEDSLFPKIKVNELKNLPIKRFGAKLELKISLMVGYIVISKRMSNDKNNGIALFFERLIDAMVYELYLPEEIKAGGAEVLKHLTNLPELEEGQDEKNLKTIEKVYTELSDPKHPISAAMHNMQEIEEIKIIEGRK